MRNRKHNTACDWIYKTWSYSYTQLQIFRNTILKYSIQYISRMFKVVMLACISPLIYNYSRYFIVSTVHWMAY